MKNVTLKILLAWIVIALSPMQAFAIDKDPNTINEIIFFGDSLSDNGNLYSSDFGTFPKSPPYFKGRFSNGPTWAEVVADHFKDTNQIDSTNFAYGGESVLYHDTNLPYSVMLDQSLFEYFTEVDPFGIHPDLSHTLYVLLLGANDYLWGSEDPDKDTTLVTNGLENSVERLINKGGRNILLLNLPDLSMVPAARIGGDVQMLKQLTVLHNKKLLAISEELQKKHPEASVKVFDYYSVTNEILADPAAYNKKYNTHITNITDACYTGGYQLIEDKNQAAKIAADLQHSSQTLEAGIAHKNPVAGKMNFNELAQSIASNPVLALAYQAQQNALAGVQSCADPSSYLFWDMVHPSAQGHALTGKTVIEYIEQNYTM
jgi:phospholipase/lecithinase/hemolysin